MIAGRARAAAVPASRHTGYLAREFAQSGTSSAEALHALARQNLANLARYDYFPKVLVDRDQGRRIALAFDVAALAGGPLIAVFGLALLQASLTVAQHPLR